MLLKEINELLSVYWYNNSLIVSCTVYPIVPIVALSYTITGTTLLYGWPQLSHSAIIQAWKIAEALLLIIITSGISVLYNFIIFSFWQLYNFVPIESTEISNKEVGII